VGRGFLTWVQRGRTTIERGQKRRYSPIVEIKYQVKKKLKERIYSTWAKGTDWGGRKLKGWFSWRKIEKRHTSVSNPKEGKKRKTCRCVN